jgi:hypothetical protein
VVPAAVPGGAAGDALKKAGIIAALLAMAFCAIPVPQRGAAPAQLAQSAGTGPLRAGAGQARIELSEHPVLAGYGGHRRARVATEPVYAKALVVEAAGGRAIIASIDTLLIPPGFARPEGCALIAATHTHTGPGGLWENLLAGLLGAGAPDAVQRAAVERALREAVAQATAALGPAELLVGREPWPSGPARPRSEGKIDPELVAVRLRRPGGAAVATLVVYAMHPTSAPHEVLSADWPGQLQAGDAPAIVLQGAGGNATWPRDAPLAQPIAAEVERLLADAPPLSAAPLSCSTRVPPVPPAQASRRVPWLLRTAVTNVLRLAFSPQALQTRIELGPVTLFGVPGEPAGELGLAQPRRQVVIGLADGYLGYVETPRHWDEGLGESGKTYFGPGLAKALGLSPY